MTQHDRPCGECPFRPGGADGGADPLTYVGQARAGMWLPCHKSPGYFDRPRDPGHAQCAGAAIFRANCGWAEGLSRLPHARRLLALPRSDLAFGSPEELVAYHAGADPFAVRLLLRLNGITPEKLALAELGAAGVSCIPLSDEGASDGKG